jgi:hypothetical protein
MGGDEAVAGPAIFEVADAITAIDTFMGGRERYTAGYLLGAHELTLVEKTGPGTSVEPVARSVAHLGVAASEQMYQAVLEVIRDGVPTYDS